jgi:glycosyltransferase involved in cell wall biosynthesis
LIECFPDADLFAIVDMLPEADRGRIIGDRAVTTSFIQKLPGARKHFRRYLPLMPLAIEQMDMSKYDVVISSSTANNVDVWLANSTNVARRIRKTYGKHTDVLHPPVRVEDFSFAAEKVDYYFTCSRLVKYKRIDLLVDAFLAKPKSELIVVGEGPDLPALKRRAGDAPISISSVAGPMRKSGNFSGTRAPFSSPPTRTSGSPRSRPRQAAHQ